MTPLARVRAFVKGTRFWALARHLLPKYHRPLISLAAAKVKAAFNAHDAQEDIARALVMLGEVKLASDCPADAISHFTAALLHAPRCAQAYLGRSDALLRQGRRADGLEDHRRAAELGGRCSQPRLHEALGAALMSDRDDERRLAEASAHFSAAIDLAPAKLENYDQAGQAAYLRGRMQEAQEFWSRGLAEQRAQAAARGLDKLGIRFLGESWFASVGHIGKLDYYVKMGLLGLRPQQRTILALHPTLKIPNRALLDQWRPYIEIVDDPSALGLSWADAALLKDEFRALTFVDGTTRWFHPAAAFIQSRWEEQQRPPLLRLSEADAARGRDCLKRLGLPEDAWHVGLHVREAGFWDGLDREHPTTRDADINSYFEAIRSVTQRGGWVIRMGDHRMSPLPPMERVIDYARSPLKSDWMDVFLWATSRFFLGTTSGPIHVAPIFGVPCVSTNWSVLARPSWYGDDLWIPKLWRSTRDNRRLRFDEAFSAGMGHMEWRRQFEGAGVTVEDNAAEDINAVTLEMLDRVEGRRAYSADDERRQDEFRRLAEAHYQRSRARMGRDFLRKHDALLPIKCAA